MNEYEYSYSLYEVISNFFYFAIFFYGLFVMFTYIALSSFSIRAAKRYINENKFVEFKDILNSPIAPSMSLIAPAFNESITIIENIRSHLSLHYVHFEVIIVNDGSKDDTMEKVIKEYGLEKVNFAFNYRLPKNPVRGVYKSKNPAFKHLVVVDKENGGKADALNTGINISKYDYIICIDVDCALEQKAILILMKPVVEQTDKKVIATGGVVRIANSCRIENGK